MKLKLDAEGHAVLQDGKPVYVHDDGKEVAFDAAGTVATISRLNGEAKSHRERAEAAEGKLKAFEGIDDPAAAKEAIKTVKNFKDKQFVEAGEVEKVKSEAIKAIREGELASLAKERDSLLKELYSEKIGGSFSRSKFIAEKAAIPADLVQAKFGGNFSIKDGKIVAKDADGKEIYSRSRPGELADFEESLEILIDQYPHKDQILKGKGSSGSGTDTRGADTPGGGNKKPGNAPQSWAEAKNTQERVAFLKAKNTKG